MFCCNNKSLFTIFFIIFTWLLANILSRNLPFSKLYFYVDNEDEFLQRFSLYRNSSYKALNEIKLWMKENNRLSEDGLLFSKPVNQQPFCVGIISKERKGLNTIYESIASLLTRIQLKYENDVDITIFNVDDNIKRESLNNLTSLVKIENVHNSFGTLIAPLAYNPKVREEADYAAIMKRLYDKKCKYALLIEDDAIATTNWYEKTIKAIDRIKNKDKWLSLKLFTSFQTFDWIFNVGAIFKTVISIVILTIVQSLVLSYAFSTRKKQKTSILPLNQYQSEKNQCSKLCRNLSKKKIFFLFLNSIGLQLILNKFSVNPIGNGVQALSQGYNTVAIVYPNLQLKLLSDHYEENIRKYLNAEIKRFFPKDLLLDSYRKEKLLNEFITEPALFQHIGIYSSLGFRGNSKFHEFQYDPFESYSFEDFYKPIDFDPKFWLNKSV